MTAGNAPTMRVELDESDRLAGVFVAERAEATAWLATQAGIAIAPAAAAALVDWLVRRLVACAHTALDDERRRTTDLGPEAFARYVRDRDRWPRFLARFPVVERLLRRAERHWRTTVDRYLAAIARDHDKLGATAELVDVQARAGRLAARRATLLTTLGGGRRWVYRVHDREMARWFQDVCGALNPSLSMPLHVRAIHGGDGYSWDELVEARPCTDPAQRRRFFVRAGMLVRLAERLAAVDLHCENVLAAGELPVVVDVETLFSLRPTSGIPALDALERSPLGSGLIGVPAYGDPGRPAVSRAGFHPGGRLVMPLPAWRLAAMDAEVGGLEQVYPVDHVAPTIPAALADHVADILAGYDEMEAVLAADPTLSGLLASAPALPVRALGAGGAVHDEVLHRGLAAELLGAEATRDAYLASCQLTAAERAAIVDLELPRHLATVGAHPATRAGVALTATERARHHDLIQTAIALSDDRPAVPRPRPIERASFTSHAVAIGDFLLAVRFAGGDWHAAVWVPWAGARTLGVAGPDLLSGKAGLALAFSYLYRIAGQPRFRDAALAALAAVPGAEPFASLGGYVGLGGALYALARCAELVHAPELADDARMHVRTLPAAALVGAPNDLVLGLSGLVLGALALEPPPDAWLDAVAGSVDRGWLVAGGHPAWVPPPSSTCALALARAGRSIELPLDLPLAWRPDAETEALAAALAHPGDLLDDVDLALAGARIAPGDPRFPRALVDRAEHVLERRARTGRWFPNTSVAERHDLSVLTGLPAIVLALLAAEAPGEVRSVRRLE